MGVSIVPVMILLAVLPIFECTGFPAASFELERSLPLMNASELAVRDKARHARILHAASIGSYVNFPVGGVFIGNIPGLYISKVRLGTPPRDFHVQIDTGNNNLWVSCSSCKNCPTTTEVKSISHLEFFNPRRSPTSTPVGCHDKKCKLDSSSNSNCSSHDINVCRYDINYLDGSATSGFYVSDLLHYNSEVGSSAASISTAPIVFGCSEEVAGPLTDPSRVVDGIFGFGQEGISVVSQLASQGITPNMFSHCLNGDAKGGGTLVLGEVQVPNMVYSPFNTSVSCYNLDLHSISVNGQTLAIDPSVFSFPAWGMSGAILDSGTSLAYLPPAAYQVFASAINAAVPLSVTVTIETDQCYHFNSSNKKVLPLVEFNFGGGAALVLSYQDYLLPWSLSDDEEIWCLGFKEQVGIPLLGDLVLRNKLVVYDLVHHRIGWTDYDCSKMANAYTDRHSDAMRSVSPEFIVWSIVSITTLLTIQLIT